jgi:hypothetical protein
VRRWCRIRSLIYISHSGTGSCLGLGEEVEAGGETDVDVSTSMFCSAGAGLGNHDSKADFVDESSAI